MADAALPPPPSANSESRSLLREPGVVQRLICGTFAWGVTTFPFAFGRGGGGAAMLAAAAALVAAVAGPLIFPHRRRLGRHLGISAFLGLVVATWLLAPGGLDITRIDLVLAMTGSVSWMVYAFSWGEPWKFRPDVKTDDMSGALRARTQLPALAVPIASLGVLAAAALLVLAYRVRDSSRALLAQVVAIGLGVALVTVAADLAIARGKKRPPTSDLPRVAVRSLLLLAGFALLGAALLILRKGS
jgi:Ca2+/Na+ antiporter